VVGLDSLRHVLATVNVASLMERAKDSVGELTQRALSLEVYDTVSKALEGVDVTSITTQDYKFAGITAVGTKVVAAPCESNKLLIYDTESKVLEGVDVTNVAKGEFKFDVPQDILDFYSINGFLGSAGTCLGMLALLLMLTDSGKWKERVFPNVTMMLCVPACQMIARIIKGLRTTKKPRAGR